jgi:CelD/BcsL family acetyltransferase involved in cellulose biosynthesis
MIQYLLDKDRVTVIDYGPGDESYKKNWVSEKKEIKRLLIFSKTLKGRYLSLLTMRILPFLERHKQLKKIKRTLIKRTNKILSFLE